MTTCDVAIVGGGASGLALAALLADKTEYKICVLERGARAGKKLAASGNGQGNVGNISLSAANYHGGGATPAWHIISRYKDIWQRFFHGKFTADERGRIYPAGRQASALSDSLIGDIKRGGVQLVLNAEVTDIRRNEVGYQLKISSGDIYFAKFVALCAGGKAQKQFGTDGSAYALAQKLGHKITPLFPSLVQLKTETSHIKTLRGIRADCDLAIARSKTVLAHSRGDVIFTEYGISGNAVFSVSPAVAGVEGLTAVISFAPDFSEEELAADIRAKQTLGYDESELLALTLNNQIGRAVIRYCGCGDAEKIAHAVKNFCLPVLGTLGFDYAQATRGGVDFGDIKSNLESAYSPNLFFAGEILDVDGDCGGYNLTWAFSSAALVAEEIAGRKL